MSLPETPTTITEFGWAHGPWTIERLGEVDGTFVIEVASRAHDARLQIALSPGGQRATAYALRGDVRFRDRRHA